MTPDTRPIGVLTAEILATASHWCLHGDGIADIRPAAELVLRPPAFDGDLPPLMHRDECYWNDDSGWMCYPCTLQPNGLVVPEPWPVMDGEEIIDVLEGIDPARYDMCLSPATNVWTVYEGRMGWLSCGFRQDMHPAPRTGGKWVWEKDRC